MDANIFYNLKFISKFIKAASARWSLDTWMPGSWMVRMPLEHHRSQCTFKTRAGKLDLKT